MTTNYNAVTTRVNVVMGINGIGVRMRVARITSGKTVRALAEEIGLDTSTIYKYENGRIDRPAPDKLAAIAESTDVSGMWLLSGIGRPCRDEERNEAIQFCLESIETTTPPVSKRRAYL